MLEKSFEKETIVQILKWRRTK